MATKVFDFETQASLNVRLQVTESQNHTYQKKFVIEVTDVNEAPSAVPGGPFTLFTTDTLRLQGSGNGSRSRTIAQLCMGLELQRFSFDADETGADPEVTFSNAGVFTIAAACYRFWQPRVVRYSDDNGQCFAATQSRSCDHLVQTSGDHFRDQAQRFTVERYRIGSRKLRLYACRWNTIGCGIGQTLTATFTPTTPRVTTRSPVPPR